VNMMLLLKKRLLQILQIKLNPWSFYQKLFGLLLRD